MRIFTEYLSSGTLGVAVGVILTLRLVFTRAKYVTIPGPFFASLTDFVRLYWTYGNQPFYKHISLHQQYGKIVRIGPNTISVSDPAEIQTIYGFNYDFGKSDFYHVMGPYPNGKRQTGIISPMPGELHRKIKGPPTRILSTTNILQFEEFVDDSIALFIRRLADVIIDGNPIDIAYWFNLLTLDTMGELTFSKKYGHLETGTDVDNMAADGDKHFQRVSLIGQTPWIDTRLYITPILTLLLNPPLPPMIKFQINEAMARKELWDKGITPSGPLNKDFLSQFTRAEAADASLPQGISMTWTATNVGAGGGTTATTLTALVYYVAKGPSTYKKLMSELRDAGLSGSATWSECEKLVYLDACIREAERLRPGVGLHLERVVPAKGATICGKHLTGGTIVGINPWVVNRDRGVFGEDADVWRAERWLVGEEQRRTMEKSILTFGAGSRICYGKNIARLILFKTAISLFSNYKIEIVDQTKWQCQGRWFTSHSNAFVTLKAL